MEVRLGVRAAIAAAAATTHHLHDRPKIMLCTCCVHGNCPDSLRGLFAVSVDVVYGLKLSAGGVGEYAFV